MQLQAKSRLCPIWVPLGQKGFADREGGIAPLQYRLPKAPLLYARSVGRCRREGCSGVRLSAEIGVHMLGPLKLLAEVS